MIYIGTSGFTLQNFYPDSIHSSEKLKYYADIFSTVEINSTFYHMPRESTLLNWQKAVPTNFIFSFKVFGGVTHQGALDFDALAKWFSSMKTFATTNRQHIMLFQFPSSFPYNQKTLETVLNIFPDTYAYAFEFRHLSWFTEKVYKQILDMSGTVVWSDSPVNQHGIPIWPKVDLESPFTYMRLHGNTKLYYSNYSSQELQTIAQFIQPKKQVYLYFNNDAKAHAADNAQELLRLI